MSLKYVMILTFIWAFHQTLTPSGSRICWNLWVWSGAHRLVERVKRPTHIHGHTLEIIITWQADDIVDGEPLPERYSSDHAAGICKLIVAKPLLRTKPERAHTICLGSHLLFCSKCTRFTVCLTYSRISLTLLAPGRLDGFSIGRYEKNCESFDLYAAKFESGAMRFWGENRPGAWTLSKQGFHPCPSIIKKSQPRVNAFEAKGRLYITKTVNLVHLSLL